MNAKKTNYIKLYLIWLITQMFVLMCSIPTSDADPFGDALGGKSRQKNTAKTPPLKRGLKHPWFPVNVPEIKAVAGDPKILPSGKHTKSY